MLHLGTRDLLFLAFCVLAHLTYRYRKWKRLPYPPGPTRWPIVGNAFTIPLTYPSIFYRDLGTRLGTKIVYLESFGTPILVINNVTVAQELLEKRSAIYSSRPPFPMLTEVIGFEKFFSVMPYGDEWRIHRRIFEQYFSEKYLSRSQEKALEFVRKGLLLNLLTSPHKLHEHVRNCIGGFSISITYGLPVQRQCDPLIQSAEQGFTAVAAAGSPGKYFVNIIRPLKYVPDWMPGAGFKKEGKKLRKTLDQLMDEPYQATVKIMKDGTARLSFVEDTLERLERRSQDDFKLQACYVKQVALQVFGAASETTVASLMTFILGMLIRPDVQIKAQQEIDSVVGSDRLPDFSDLPHLTYLSAIIKEVFRWNPITPLGMPHKTSQEDVYTGYYIPKDCMVMANVYAMLHDDTVFPEPTSFKPERFVRHDGTIRDDVIDPEVVATFGFGRRVCPGSHIAKAALYIAAASILHVFDISAEHDPDGKPVEIKPQFTPASLTSEPLPFPCKVTPRRGRDVQALLQEYMGNDPI